MSVPRKNHSNSVLKNLPAEKQGEIVDYADGRNGMKPHSVRTTVAWLKRSRIKTNSRSLCEFRRWYLMREQMQADEEVCMQMLQVCKEKGWTKTAVEEQKAAQMFFNRLTVGRQDPKMWSLVQRVRLSNEKVELDKRKLKLEARKYEDSTAKGKKSVNKPKLTPDEKQKKIRHILGTE